MTITDEDIQWNDHYLPGVLSNNSMVRNEANSQVLSRIESDPTYLLVLLEYCLTKPCDSVNFKLSIIAVSRIIKRVPQFLLDSFQEFQPRFCSVFEYISNVPGSYIQSLLADVFIKTFQLIYKTTPDQHLLDEQYEFFDNVFNIALENLNTFAFCFYVRQYTHFSKTIDKFIEISIVYKIITEYYPLNQDFELLKSCLKYFCEATSKENDLDESFDQIFEKIYNLAESSINLDENKFNDFWFAIQELNIAHAEPFFNIAYDILMNSENDEINLSLIRFIETHVALVSPEQVEGIIMCLYNTIYNLKIFHPSDFSIVKALLVVEYDTFGFVYDLIKNLLENQNEFNYMIYLITLFYFTDCHLYSFESELPEIVETCKEMLTISLNDTLSNVFSTVLNFFSEIMDIYQYNESVKSIPSFLLEFITAEQDPEIENYILATIARGVPSIDKRDFFNKLLEIFLSCYQDINLETASLYFDVLSLYLPDGRLFPEKNYESINSLIQHFLPCLDLSLEEIQDKTICITLSIFIFKMYIIDQEPYSELLLSVVHNISVAFSYINDNPDILILASEMLIQYIKLFGDKAFEYLHESDYYSNLYQFLFSNGFFAEANKLNPYTMVLAYICKYDKDNFKDRNRFYNIIYKIIIGNSKDYNLKQAIECAKKFFYLGLSAENFSKISSDLVNLISHSIDVMDTNKLYNLIDLYVSFIKPTHIERRKIFFGEEDDYESKVLGIYIENLENLVDQLLAICNTSPTNYSSFLIPLLQATNGLCYYDCDIVHEVVLLLIDHITDEETEKSFQELHHDVCFFIDISNVLFQAKTLREDEAEKIVNIFRLILTDERFTDIYAEVYTSISLLILIDAEYAMPFMKILNEHWASLDNEYLLSILGTLFLMIFVMVPDNFSSEDVFRMTEEITDRFQPLRENCNYYIKSSIDFLSNYPDVPINIKEKFLHNYITYLSYQGYCYHIFSVKEEVHERLLEVVKILISEIPNCEEIIESCFPESPRALQGTLEMLEITLQQEQD